MNRTEYGRVAIVYPGDRTARRDSTPENNRFSAIFRALAGKGLHAEPAVYHDDFRADVRAQLMGVDAVLVWVNPIEDGRDRSHLDAMLCDVAASGVFVSAHPDVILKMGTKEVVYRTRELGWGSDTRLYRQTDELARELPARLAGGQARVLKQLRGHSGLGVWKVQLAAGMTATTMETPVRVRHARRGAIEEEITLGEFVARCAPYFAAGGGMIDQAYQERLPEGMIRCYLVHGTVAGFGHQAINALCPAAPGASPTDAPQPGPRLYHPPDKAEFQALKTALEREWVPALQRLLGIATEQLPILWDCDFLLGAKREDGSDGHVLCEINVSSVAPYPESVVPCLATATLAQVRAARRRRGPGR